MFGLQTRPNRAVRLLLGWHDILSADVLVWIFHLISQSHFILSVQLDYNANDSKTINREVHIVLDSDTILLILLLCTTTKDLKNVQTLSFNRKGFTNFFLHLATN